MSLFAPEKKILTQEAARLWRENMQLEGRTVALTNGCFDILHRGHAEYLMAARGLADTLIVLLNSDSSVRALKGPSRPVNCEYDRAYLLGCMEFVDAVLVFDSKRCCGEIDLLHPDFYAKGADYTVETLDPEERAALEKAGTRIRFIPFVPDHSTSAVIAKASGK